MFDTIAKLSLLVAALALFTAGADAQSSRAQRLCAKSKDQVRCMCAATNGGRIYRSLDDSRRAWLAMYSRSDMEAYIACMKRKGRGNS